ncbi:uncharacterized protein BCR38DRAFT_482791 [Pseudomassariella vexata]|uniref:Uncharacterized protein n=1 Tax=Pseudomassariella vexata TaxID=1141098 RepID=A0A1Y2E8H3_9PEZI|nr:uncharacterized protein BCR38DRAFT_482791 [Pseudomassariella vexata]ORY67155.1 hypothetical protein BCR38DRAFT_482791 [Pseudomassariella vexata]
MPSIFGKIQAKIELYRLEQRYTRNRNRRSTFISNAVYVDGEYVYNTPNNTGSSTNSSAMSASIEEQQRRSLEEARSPHHDMDMPPAQKKRLNRFSSMPGFGSLSKASSRSWRPSEADVNEVR